MISQRSRCVIIQIVVHMLVYTVLVGILNPADLDAIRLAIRGVLAVDQPRETLLTTHVAYLFIIIVITSNY